uniref:Uncharacterized protein n=1 Tax=Trypanosoma vivax (strain Y486) TaxID=1055687 RepID=G0TY25_TRYVY|nr:hypothetical protein TVY486_0702070 [Trypanosoma vivax Y486]
MAVRFAMLTFTDEALPQAVRSFVLFFLSHFLSPHLTFIIIIIVTILLCHMYVLKHQPTALPFGVWDWAARKGCEGDRCFFTSTCASLHPLRFVPCNTCPCAALITLRVSPECWNVRKLH